MHSLKSSAPESVEDFALRLLEGRKKAAHNIRNTEAANARRSKVNRQTIILNMAERLSATAFRNLPAKKRNIASRRVLRLTATDLLKKELEVDEVIEALEKLVQNM